MLIKIRQQLGIPRAHFLEHMSIAVLRTLETKPLEDLNLEQIELYLKGFDRLWPTTVDEFIVTYIYNDWPIGNKIRFWDMIKTSYKLSANKTLENLKDILKSTKVSVPSYPTMWKWLHSENKGYNQIPIKYLMAMHWFRSLKYVPKKI